MNEAIAIYLGDLDWDRWRRRAIALGDMVVFGSRIAHRSGPNLTPSRRAAIFGTYHFESERPEMSTEYWAHRRVNFPPDHGKW